MGTLQEDSKTDWYISTDKYTYCTLEIALPVGYTLNAILMQNKNNNRLVCLCTLGYNDFDFFDNIKTPDRMQN